VLVAIASDHAGFALKESIKALLEGLHVAYRDLGTAAPTPVDYPDFAEAVSREIVEGRADRGILACGTGIGMAIAANKIPGIRAAVVWDENSARLARAHNDANIMTVGGRTTSADQVAAMVRVFLSTEYENGHHDARLRKIARLEHRDAPPWITP
jgi:RpiB/LacA/LacB family sugar-phosphate isomerase